MHVSILKSESGIFQLAIGGFEINLSGTGLLVSIPFVGEAYVAPGSGLSCWSPWGEVVAARNEWRV